MASLPLEPRISRMLLEAQKHNCTIEVAVVAAFLSVRNIFYLPKDRDEQMKARTAHFGLKNRGSDIMTFFNVFTRFCEAESAYEWCRENYVSYKALQEVDKIIGQLFKIMEQNGIELTNATEANTILKAVIAGLAYNLHMKGRSYSYESVFNGTEGVFIHPSSALFESLPKWMTCSKIVQTKKLYAFNCVDVPVSWLPELFPSRAAFGLTLIKSHDPEHGIYETVTEVLFDGYEVGKAFSEVTHEKAEKIQEQALKHAKEEGWIPLKFKEDFTAQYNGRCVRAWSLFEGSLEKNATYFCKLEDFLGETRATLMFQLYNFILPEAPVGESAVNALAAAWGARVKC